MKVFFLTVCLLISFSVISQDSLVFFHEVRYDSPYEKDVFDNFFSKKKTDFFDLFIASGHILTQTKIENEKVKFSTFIDELDLAKFDGKKNDKKIKAIYEAVHKKYLSKFETGAGFEELFINGSYNATTASALCALILERERIPYMLKEEPGTIYIISYPNAERILLKPEAGEQVSSFDPVYKQTFINNLKEHKIISAKETSGMSVDALFDKYYFGGHQDLTLINLIGIQYMNQAILELESQNMERAYQQLEKSYLFFPSERTRYLMFQVGTEMLQTMKTKNEDHALLLAKVSRFSRYGITAEMIEGEFGMVVQRLLFEKSDPEKLAAYYAILEQELKSPALKNQIQYIYHFELGRYFYNQGRYTEALPYFEESMNVKPSSQDGINAFVGTLIQLTSANDNLTTINDFKKYVALHPMLKENNNFNTVLASAYLIQFGREYDIGSPTEGAKYQTEFENMLKDNPQLPVDKVMIGNVYSVAAVYFYRKGQTTKARSIIEKGLGYAPNNYELLARKRMIN